MLLFVVLTSSPRVSKQHKIFSLNQWHKKDIDMDKKKVFTVHRTTLLASEDHLFGGVGFGVP